MSAAEVLDAVPADQGGDPPGSESEEEASDPR